MLWWPSLVQEVGLKQDVAALGYAAFTGAMGRVVVMAGPLAFGARRVG